MSGASGSAPYRENAPSRSRDTTWSNLPRPIQTFQLSTTTLVGRFAAEGGARSRATGAPTLRRHSSSWGRSFW